MSDDQIEIYTVREHDTLSGIASKRGMSWQDIENQNGISDPRSLRPGQRLNIRRKIGKLRAHVLDADHNPLDGVSYVIKSGINSLSGKTKSGGQTIDFWPKELGEVVEIYIQKLTGEWKKVHETTAGDLGKLITLVSPRLKIQAETQSHPLDGNEGKESHSERPKAPRWENNLPQNSHPTKVLRSNKPKMTAVQSR
jgi:LysM repeat protein